MAKSFYFAAGSLHFLALSYKKPFHVEFCGLSCKEVYLVDWLDLAGEADLSKNDCLLWKRFLKVA